MSGDGQPTQPHDALVKSLLGPPERAAAVLRGIVPPALAARLDWTTLRRLPESFVDRNLRLVQSDLLYAARLRDGPETLVYLLFEHQSTADPLMAWRLLRYVVRVLERWRRAHPRAKRLPAVFPVVLYHGASAWSAPTEVLELFDLPPDLLADVQRHLPRLGFLLDDLSARTDDDLRNRALDALEKLVLLSLKHGRHTRDPLGFFRSVAGLLHEVLTAPSGLDALEQILRYHVTVNDAVDIEALGRLLTIEVGEEAREVLMTAGERLIAQGEERGLQKGLQKGRQQGEARLLLKQLHLRFGPPPAHVVEQVERASIPDLDRWAERVLTADSLEEVFADG